MIKRIRTSVPIRLRYDQGSARMVASLADVLSDFVGTMGRDHDVADTEAAEITHSDTLLAHLKDATVGLKEIFEPSPSLR